MKKFFKKNWWIITGFAIGILLLLFSALTYVCLIMGLIVVGVMLVVISLRLKKRYNVLVDEQENDESIFDATKFDYDEDIYILNTKPKFKTKIKKGLLSKLSALTPSILFGVFGVGFILLAITMSIRLIF